MAKPIFFGNFRQSIFNESAITVDIIPCSAPESTNAKVGNSILPLIKVTGIIGAKTPVLSKPGNNCIYIYKLAFENPTKSEYTSPAGK